MLTLTTLDNLERLLAAAKAEIRGGLIGRVLKEEFIQDGWMPANAEYMAELLTHSESLIAVARAAQEAWPYTRDSGDEPNPKDVLWSALQKLKRS